MPVRFTLRQFVPEGQWFHFAKTTFSGRRREPEHTHEYMEFFWVTDGAGIHRLNGENHQLSAGDLVCVFPEDKHVFRTLPGKSWTIANLAFDPDVLEELLSKSPQLSWGDLKKGVLLTAEQQMELETQVDQLLDHPQSQFSLERFLSNLLFMLLPGKNEPWQTSLPDWLRNGLIELRRQEMMQSGLEAFLKTCARSQEHVTRECRKHLGKTPTAIINDARVDYARTQLVSTDKSNKEICWECGFRSSAYFHKLFKAEFGCSPVQYRKRQRAIFQSPTVT